MFYMLPVGMGIACGLFGRGFVLPWAAEALVVAVCWGAGSFLFRNWKYQAYVTNCHNSGQRPSPASFVALQSLSTGAVVLLVAVIVMGLRWIIGVSDGHSG